MYNRKKALRLTGKDSDYQGNVDVSTDKLRGI